MDRGAWWATVRGVAKSWIWQRLSLRNALRPSFVVLLCGSCLFLQQIRPQKYLLLIETCVVKIKSTVWGYQSVLGGGFVFLFDTDKHLCILFIRIFPFPMLLNIVESAAVLKATKPVTSYKKHFCWILIFFLNILVKHVL